MKQRDGLCTYTEEYRPPELLLNRLQVLKIKEGKETLWKAK